MKNARILVALEKQVVQNVQNALKDYDLVVALKLNEAKRLISEDGIELIIIGVHFDDSRAMDLIKVIRLDRGHKNVPIIITRMLPSAQSKLLHDTLDVMKVVLAISDYLELEGDPESDSKLRRAVEKALDESPVKKNR